MGTVAATHVLVKIDIEMPNMESIFNRKAAIKTLRGGGAAQGL